MKLKKQKKGMVLILFLAVLFIFVIMPMLFVKIHTKKSQFPKTLGETQLTLLEIYQKSEKALFYIDQAAKYSTKQAMEDLGITTLDSSFLTEEFKNKLSNYLNEYSKVYDDEDVTILINNYDFVIIDNELIGIATRDIITKEDIISYSIKPSFTISIE